MYSLLGAGAGILSLGIVIGFLLANYFVSLIRDR